MPNRNKLKGRIAEKGTTIKEVAEIMKISPYILGQKIAGKSTMTLTEANQLQEILGIPDTDFKAYFFS